MTLIKFFYRPRLVWGALCLLGLLAFPGPAQPADVSRPELKKTLWEILAHLPPETRAAADSPGLRQLELAAAGEQPQITLRAVFQDPSDPWPHSIAVEVLPRWGRPWRFEDFRPFGAGALKRCSGLAGGEEACSGLDWSEEAALFNEIASRLRARRPLMTSVDWRELDEGLWLARASLKMGVRMGSPELVLVKFDPRLYQLKPFHEREFFPPVSLPIAGWADRLPNSPILLTAGQYYPDRSYMGLLKKDHHYLFSKRHPKWQGYLASGLAAGPAGPGTLVADGKYDNGRWWSAYPHLLQTFVLLDEKGRPRVVDSENLASRVVVAQDKKDYIIVMALAEGAITLSDLAFVLKASPLELKTVLGLDGGLEAQLAVRDAAGLRTITGAFSQNRMFKRVWPGRSYIPTLPAILALERLAASRPETESKPPLTAGPAFNNAL